MKKLTVYLTLGLIGVFFVVLLTGCGEAQKGQSEMAIGNWSQLRNRAYILLITNPNGGWSSSVRIADATSRIVKSKGSAKGSWNIENGQMIFSVLESDIVNIWEPNATLFFDIISLTEIEMHLKDETGWVGMWKQTAAQKVAVAEENAQAVLAMGPVVVNLNKNRSNDKDRYLCLNLNLILKELMPEQVPPPIHPRAHDAAIIFLSSLVQNDVKDFDDLKNQGKKLVDVINPYIEGMVKEVKIEHVIVANSVDKVEEFIIEHTMTDQPVPEDGEDAGTKEKAEQEDKS